jgi:hypothetical protein
VRVVKRWNERVDLLAARAKAKLFGVKFDVQVVVAGGYFLSELIALRAWILGIVLVYEGDAKHSTADKDKIHQDIRCKSNDWRRRTWQSDFS